LVDFITNGPLVAIAVSGERAIDGCRQMIGATIRWLPPGVDSSRSRADDWPQFVHGSDSAASAIVSWRFLRRQGFRFAASRPRTLDHGISVTLESLRGGGNPSSKASTRAKCSIPRQSHHRRGGRNDFGVVEEAMVRRAHRPARTRPSRCATVTRNGITARAYAMR